MYYQRNNPHGGADGTITADFSISVNPLGTPERVREAARAALENADRYPDPCCAALTQGIAAAEGVPVTAVLCGNGASELIYAYCAAVKPKRALETAPTFSEYSAALSLYGCQPYRFQLKQENGFLPDSEFLAVLESCKPDVVFLCNPGNPTGRLFPAGLLDETASLCQERGIRLFLDETFLELSDGSGDSLKSRLMDFPGLFLLRSFTKSHGMAGLRLGYGLCADAALLETMSALTPPWTVSSVAQAAGLAALEERGFPARARDLIRVERRRLSEGLEQLGLWVCPSEANFLLFRGPAELRGGLTRKGIAVRDCGNFPGLGPLWYRTAVRSREENERLLQAVREVLSWR